ncbi:hypothetical protein F511_18298 [Dorcoceras hygrometricum]|uniref:Uncharacterized protein n=1 Tax=Dorcoceras hygrometricum TaxID=472368 RepID=A0A2Z7BNB3_9LAMI|nr:hypothetical protein F511_18298 [Dorcoceras hygrometricum]
MILDGIRGKMRATCDGHRAPVAHAPIARCDRGCAPVVHTPARTGRRALRPLAGTRACKSRTMLRDNCCPPAHAVRAGGRSRAHALRTGARTACNTRAGGGAPPVRRFRGGAWLRPVSRGNRHFTVGGGRLRQSGPRPEARLLRQPALEGLTRSAWTDSPRQVGRNKFRRERRRRRRKRLLRRGGAAATRAFRVRVCCKFACKNQLVVVSIQYGPFNPYIPIRSTTIGKSRVAIDPIAMLTSWRSNSDIASVTSIGYPRMSASGESLTTMHRLLHASGSHPIPPPDDPNTTKTSDLSTRQMVTTWKVRTRVVR